MRLRLEAGSWNGAEIRTAARYRFGRFAARLRTPLAPGSITAFFLYEDVPGGNDELDVEIYNDGSGRVILTSWSAGKVTNQATVRLPFDPSAGLHEYVIDFREGGVSVLVDGVAIQAWSSRLPRRPMRVMANAWWPAWLEGQAPEADEFAEVESVTITGSPDTGAPR